MLLLVALACRPPAITADPASGPMSGYGDVALTLRDAAPQDVAAVSIAGIDAYDLRPVGEALLVVVQGAPAAGPAEVRVTLRDGDVISAPAYTFEPAAPGFERFVAFGASLSQGVQSGVPTLHGALVSPSAQVARVAGAYHPLPLLVPGLVPEITADLVGPPPDCALPDFGEFTSEAIPQILEKLAGDDGIDLSLGRVDPELAPYNVAVGGSRIGTLLTGPDDLAGRFFAQLVSDPFADVGAAVTPQLDQLDALAPTVAMCSDLFGNDVVGAIVLADIDPADVTPESEFRANLVAVLDRLDASGAEVFVANTPDPSLLPATWTKRDALIAAGTPTAEVDANIAEIVAMNSRYNAILAEELGRREHVHLVDVAGAAERLRADGAAVGGDELGMGSFDGLLSLDAMHFSDTGYALLADLYVRRMNEVLGGELPGIDLEAVHAGDPFSAAALEAQGLDPSACTGP